MIFDYVFKTHKKHLRKALLYISTSIIIYKLIYSFCTTISFIKVLPKCFYLKTKYNNAIDHFEDFISKNESTLTQAELKNVLC